MENIPETKQAELISKSQERGQAEVMKIAPAINSKDERLGTRSRRSNENDRDATAPVRSFHEAIEVEVVKVAIPILKECISPWLREKAAMPVKVNWLRHGLLFVPTIGYLTIILALRKMLAPTFYEISLAVCSALVGLFLTEVWNDHKRLWDEQDRWQRDGGKDPLEECIIEVKKKCPDKFLDKDRGDIRGTDC